MNLNILDIERIKSTGAVMKVHWQASDNDDKSYALEYGTVVFDEKNPNDPDFAVYENLTEKTVLKWIRPLLDLQAIENSLQQKMQQRQKLKEPELAAGVPENWV